MARLIQTIAPKTNGIRKILFSNVIVNEIRNSTNGFIVKVVQKETPYYPPRESNDSFFTTGTALSNLGKSVTKELEGWRPFESRYRFGYAFCTNVDEITIGSELPENFHIKKIRTNTPQREGHKPATDGSGRLIMIDNKPVYTSYKFLAHYEDDEPNVEAVELDLVEEGDGILFNEITEWS
jgi:hypothetical protein